MWSDLQDDAFRRLAFIMQQVASVRSIIRVGFHVSVRGPLKFINSICRPPLINDNFNSSFVKSIRGYFVEKKDNIAMLNKSKRRDDFMHNGHKFVRKACHIRV